MTAEQLHDAIGLLPGDLLEKTDRLRQNPVKKKTNVTRYLSAAACAVVVLGGALLFRPAKGGSLFCCRSGDGGGPNG